MPKGQTVANLNAAESNALICHEVDSGTLTAMFTWRLCQGFAQASLIVDRKRRGASPCILGYRFLPRCP